MKRGRAWAGALLALCIVRDGGGYATAQEAWATTQARERTALALTLTQRGADEDARLRLEEAIQFDPTYGPAHAALGALHEKSERWDEAERVYSRALDKVLGMASAHLGRARARIALGKLADAAADVAAARLGGADRAVTLDLQVRLDIERGHLLSALGAARGLLQHFLAAGDAAKAADEKIRVEALLRLVGSLDPVTAGSDGGGLRGLLARFYGLREPVSKAK
jgi:Tfp pilus assembly protein PilF